MIEVGRALPYISIGVKDPYDHASSREDIILYYIGVKEPYDHASSREDTSLTFGLQNLYEHNISKNHMGHFNQEGYYSKISL